MRYLKVYEAFESNILNSIFRFLKEEGVKGSSDIFKKEFSDILESFNIPLSEISESNVKYLKRKEALSINGEGDRIKYIKFWFSLEKGYLCKTGTSGLIINSDSETFSEDELEKISNMFDITGKLTTLSDKAKSCKEGDYILFSAHNGRYNSNCVIVNSYPSGLARIYKDRRGSSYAVQGFVSGYCDDSNYTHLGPMVWDLSGSDYGYLAKLEIDKSMDKLVYTYNKLDPYTWNLEISNFHGQNKLVKHSLKSRYFNNNYLGEYSLKSIIEEDADFCIVVEIPMQQELKRNLSNVRDGRALDKEGYLIDNDEIKNNNLSRYYSIIFKKYNLDTNVDGEFELLNELINSFFLGKYFLIGILLNYRFDFKTIEGTIISMYDNNDRDMRIKNIIKPLYLEATRVKGDLMKFKKSNEALELLIEIGEMVSVKVLSKDIKNLSILKGVFTLLESVYHIFSKEIYFSTELKKSLLDGKDIKYTDEDIKYLKMAKDNIYGLL